MSHSTAPFFLLKHTLTHNPKEIDIWSAGVILLTILSRRFPFFNSTDDIEALIEISTIFGRRRMQSCALLHGTTFETAIPTIGDKGFGFEKLIRWSTGRTIPRPRETEDGTMVQDPAIPLLPDEDIAIEFLGLLLELDPRKRISAEQALQHDFFNGPHENARRNRADERREYEDEDEHRQGNADGEERNEEEEDNGAGGEEDEQQHWRQRRDYQGEYDDAGHQGDEQQHWRQRQGHHQEEYDPYRYD